MFIQNASRTFFIACRPIVHETLVPIKAEQIIYSSRSCQPRARRYTFCTRRQSHPVCDICASASRTLNPHTTCTFVHTCHRKRRRTSRRTLLLPRKHGTARSDSKNNQVSHNRCTAAQFLSIWNNASHSRIAAHGRRRHIGRKVQLRMQNIAASPSPSDTYHRHWY